MIVSIGRFAGVAFSRVSKRFAVAFGPSLPFNSHPKLPPGNSNHRATLRTMS